MRLKFGRIHTVVFGDRAVYAEGDRLGFAGKIGSADWPLNALDPNVGNVKWLAHMSSYLD